MISVPVSRRCNSCLFTGTFCYGSVAERFKAVLIKLGGTPQVRILSLPFKEFSSGIEQRIPNPWTVV